METYYCKNMSQYINSIKFTLEPKEHLKIGLSNLKIHIEAQSKNSTNKRQLRGYFTHQISAHTIKPLE